MAEKQNNLETVTPKTNITVDELKRRGSAVGLYSNFTEQDVINLENQNLENERIKRLKKGINKN